MLNNIGFNFFMAIQKKDYCETDHIMHMQGHKSTKQSSL